MGDEQKSPFPKGGIRQCCPAEIYRFMANPGIVGLVNSFGFFLETSMAAKSFFLSTLQGLEMEIPRTAPSPAAEKLT
jgi:hypothetical protein